MSHFLSDLDAAESLTLEHSSQRIQWLWEQVRTCSPERDDSRPGIVGQENLIRRILTAMIVAEHCLLEGNPGVAKTLTCKMIGGMAGLSFRRVQFVPDMMPSELVLTERLEYRSGRGEIVPKLGPIFTNLLLADEINRASPKVQAALLEATEERHVTPMNRPRQVIRPIEPDEAQWISECAPCFGAKRPFDPATAEGQLFVVLATQNPIEQEGVYPLSKAQEDRFAFKVIVEYPRADELTRIARHAFDVGHPTSVGYSRRDEHVRTLYFFARLRSLLLGPSSQRHWFSEQNRELREKVEALVDFTHFCPQSALRDGHGGMAPSAKDGKNGELRRTLSAWAQEASSTSHRHRANLWHDLVRHGEPLPEVLSGSSPRGLLKLIRAAHAEAFLRGHIEGGRAHPEWCDFRAVAHDVLRHRIRLTPGAEAMGMRSEVVVDFLLEWIEQWDDMR